MTRIPAARNRRRRTSAGALLLDVMLAIFVCTSVIITAVSLITTAVAASESSKQNTVAYNAARQAIENLRQYKDAKIQDGTYTDLSVFGAIPQLTEDNVLRNPQARMTVSTFRNPVKMVEATFRARTFSVRVGRAEPVLFWIVWVSILVF